MQFELNLEQSLLQASALDWLASNVSSHGEAVSSGADLWREFAELGWLGLPFSQSIDGFDGGPVDVGLLAQAMGRYLVHVPYIDSIVVAGALLESLGDAARHKRLLSQVIRGEERLALAHDEPGTSSPWAMATLEARKSTDGWVLSGRKVVVNGADLATTLIVSADGVPAGEVKLFLVDPAAHGIHFDTYQCLDGSRAADIRFDHVHVPDDALVAGTARSLLAALQRAMALGILASCWGACGAMSMLVEQTLSYITQRRQFGRTLSQFQVVQHRLAEMQVESIEAQACCESASMRAALPEADLMALASAAKIRVARAADFVAKQAIQSHGAMGVCEELPVAPAFRWLEAFQIRYGRAAMHAEFLGMRSLENRTFATSSVLPELG